MRVEIDSNHISANAAAHIVASMTLNDGWRDAASGKWFRIVGIKSLYIPGRRLVRQFYIEDSIGGRWVGTDWGLELVEYLRTDNVDYWRQTLYNQPQE